MDDVVAGLAEQHAELWGVIAGLDEASWRLPSRCEGGDVADVVLHMAQTEELAVASLEDRFGDATLALARGPAGDVDEGAAKAGGRGRGPARAGGGGPGGGPPPAAGGG